MLTHEPGRVTLLLPVSRLLQAGWIKTEVTVGSPGAGAGRKDEHPWVCVLQSFLNARPRNKGNRIDLCYFSSH